MGDLAIINAAAPVSRQSNQYLTFLLGSDLFAVGIQGVREIMEYGQLTAVPLTPRCIRGVINLRGAVVPVIDLRVRFGEQPTAITRRTCIVILEVRSDESEVMVIGVMVDAVSEVCQIDAASIEPPPPFGTTVNNDFIAGMAKLNERFVIVLAANRVLPLEQLGALNAIRPE